MVFLYYQSVYTPRVNGKDESWVWVFLLVCFNCFMFCVAHAPHNVLLLLCSFCSNLYQTVESNDVNENGSTLLKRFGLCYSFFAKSFFCRVRDWCKLNSRIPITVLCSLAPPPTQIPCKDIHLLPWYQLQPLSPGKLLGRSFKVGDIITSWTISDLIQFAVLCGITLLSK